ncbi:MAG: hypothetical protein E6152_23070 [Escherichia coli]|nr:hypothetical protein [Escherichia coli]
MAETPKLIFSAAEAPKVKEASKAHDGTPVCQSYDFWPCLRHGITMPSSEFICNKYD